MKKIVYTRPDDGGLSVVSPLSKEAVERVVGPMTQEEYIKHVWDVSVPKDAVNPRYVEEGSIPSNREFRNAWADISKDDKVNIDVAKAKEVKLAELRHVRNLELEKLDKEFLVALEIGDALGPIKLRKQALRDSTEPLKALEVSGIDDEVVLDQIRVLGRLEI